MTSPPPPPALSQMAQFTPQYWDKAPRIKEKHKLVRITNMVTEGDYDYVEFVFDNGAAFQRKGADLNPDIDLHVNLTVFVETINGELVTGMWVPEQGWAFRMTSEDLAEYAKQLSSAMHQRRQQASEQLHKYLTEALLEALQAQCDVELYGEGTVTVTGPLDVSQLAGAVLRALQQAEPNSSANAR